MQLKQFRYGDTNLAYLLWSGQEAAAIDGGADEDILGFIADNSLEFKYVLNTHMHGDHTPGNEGLLKRSSAEFISPGELCRMKSFTLGRETVEVFPVPGHTEDSIAFNFGGSLITGDTLFNGTVGNCYTRDYKTYFSSLERLLKFPQETRIFAGHDLVDYALGVADKIDPGNKKIDEYRAGYSPDSVVSTIGMELGVNPFVRFNDPSLDAFREGLGMPLETPFERWRAMMSVH